MSDDDRADERQPHGQVVGGLLGGLGDRLLLREDHH
jgi:hypothetical protein